MYGNSCSLFHQCLATVHSSVFRLCKMIPDTGRCFTGEEISNLSMHQIRLLGYHNCYIFASFMDEPPNSLLGKNWNNIYGTERSLIFLSSAMCETYKLVQTTNLYSSHITADNSSLFIHTWSSKLCSHRKTETPHAIQSATLRSDNGHWEEDEVSTILKLYPTTETKSTSGLVVE